MKKYLEWFWTSIAIGILLTAVMLFITSCSYGTYNATGSYPNQDNHKTDNCQKG